VIEVGMVDMRVEMGEEEENGWGVTDVVKTDEDVLGGSVGEAEVVADDNGRVTEMDTGEPERANDDVE
jgi:hypothetical protein